MARRPRDKEINLIVVFDGEKFPSKSREKYKNKFRSVNENNKNRSKYAAKAVDVTSTMIQDLVVFLRAEGIQCLIAPYEADSQLAYLERTNMIDAVLTEDSDLILFGCKKILFDLSHDAKEAKILCTLGQEDYTELGLKEMTHEKFVQVCILSGCDYLDNIDNIGMGIAKSLFNKNKTFDAVKAEVESTPSSTFPENYWRDFRRAEIIFKHYLVYDTINPGRRVNMTPIDDSVVNEVGGVSFLRSVEEATGSPPLVFTVLNRTQPGE
ncbi:MAG: exonuclease 1-like protein [Amphiamblys sp. WSBS2006]|nr:MAG: exonuclease 1-like protein [Amphiamblys sp. WSBS2006]